MAYCIFLCIQSILAGPRDEQVWVLVVKGYGNLFNRLLRLNLSRNLNIGELVYTYVPESRNNASHLYHICHT